ncbi:hypothetical protein SDC9_75707 [bioreactor metagenome]|uniref:Uncharacterized protein n=1 Tax=bioreactor metagenome TaxID=1076179 RepID=A0A644YLI4_9ZZZZ
MVLLDDLDDPDHLASQSIRVIRSCRNHSLQEETDDAVQFVRHRQDSSDLGFRQFAFTGYRQIVFADGSSYSSSFTLLQRIDFTHDPLQFRKFGNHVRHQIKFVDGGRTQQLRFVVLCQIKHIRKMGSNFRCVVHLIMNGADFRMECDFLQFFDRLRNGDALIFVEEE